MNEVPYTTDAYPVISITTLKGFRAQENWGRWTLGLKSKIVFNANKSGIAFIYIKISTPYKYQRVGFMMNKEFLGSIISQDKAAAYTIKLASPIEKGGNTLYISSSKSNHDGVSSAFSAGDRSDLAIAVQEITFGNSLTTSTYSSDEGYSLFQPNSLPRLQATLNNTTEIFFTGIGQKKLNYSLLSTMDNQKFYFKLNGNLLKIESTYKAGTLLRGNVLFNSNGKNGHIDIYSTDNIKSTSSVLYLDALLKSSGPTSFYVQQLEVRPANFLDVHLTSLTAILAAASCIALYRIIFYKYKSDR